VCSIGNLSCSPARKQPPGRPGFFFLSLRGLKRTAPRDRPTKPSKQGQHGAGAGRAPGGDPLPLCGGRPRAPRPRRASLQAMAPPRLGPRLPPPPPRVPAQTRRHAGRRVQRTSRAPASAAPRRRRSSSSPPSPGSALPPPSSATAAGRPSTHAMAASFSTGQYGIFRASSRTTNSRSGTRSRTNGRQYRSYLQHYPCVGMRRCSVLPPVAVTTSIATADLNSLSSSLGARNTTSRSMSVSSPPPPQRMAHGASRPTPTLPTTTSITTAVLALPVLLWGTRSTP
jgi:hypothetical protein